jgi:stage III sporulation protein AG
MKMENEEIKRDELKPGLKNVCLKLFANKGRFSKLGILLGIGLLLMALSAVLKPAAREAPLKDAQEKPGVSVQATAPLEEDIEKKLSIILSKIKGAGMVEAAVVFENEGSFHYVFNENSSENFNSEGGEIKSTSFSMNRDLAAVNNNPLLEEACAPKIKGVLVVAQGAGNTAVKREIFSAVMVLLGVEAHKIVIAEGNNE